MITQHLNRRPGLAATRGRHFCPKCQFYAYHGLPSQQQVTVGNRVHHPACSILRGCIGNGRRVQTGASSSAVDQASDAPFVVLGLIGAGMLVAARR